MFIFNAVLLNKNLRNLSIYDVITIVKLKTHTHTPTKQTKNTHTHTLQIEIMLIKQESRELKFF